MSRDASATRDKLLRSAEHLIARHGLDVPIREIHAHAGQRNASAIQYHFGGKEELLQAVIDHHAPTPDDMEAVRVDLDTRTHDPRGFMEAIVRRLSGYLGDESSRDYVRVSFHVMQRVSMRAVLAEGSEHHSLTAVKAETELLRSILPELPDRIVRERAVAAISFVAFEVSERARLIDDGEAEVLLDEEDFIANLTDMAAAILTAPTSIKETTCGSTAKSR